MKRLVIYMYTCVYIFVLKCKHKWYMLKKRTMEVYRNERAQNQPTCFKSDVK